MIAKQVSSCAGTISTAGRAIHSKSCPHHHAELCCMDGLVEGQHELPLCLLAFIALGHPQQAAHNVCVKSQSLVSCHQVAGLQGDASVKSGALSAVWPASTASMTRSGPHLHEFQPIHAAEGQCDGW